MEKYNFAITTLEQRLNSLECAYQKYVEDGNCNKNSMVAKQNRKNCIDLKNAIETLQARKDKSKLLLADVSNLLPLDDCITEWEKFVKQHNLKGNAGQKSVYFGMFLHGWRGRNSEGFWQ